VPLPINSQPIEFVKLLFNISMMSMSKFNKKITQCNENCKLTTNVHYRKLDFNKGDYGIDGLNSS